MKPSEAKKFVQTVKDSISSTKIRLDVLLQQLRALEGNKQ